MNKQKIKKISAIEGKIYELVDDMRLTANERMTIEHLVEDLVSEGLDFPKN
jgi:low affinity Fe/Cu permease